MVSKKNILAGKNKLNFSLLYFLVYFFLFNTSFAQKKTEGNFTDLKILDNPEITAYIQVKDLTDENNNEVFVFNGWMFSSSPSITPFDHPVYDVWLINCY